MLSLYELKKILNPKQDSTPEDDFRIIQSWAEYDEKSSKPPEERNLKYLCYELEVMNPDTGEITHFYKAIKFARVIRLPANAKQSTAFMDMQEQILAGVHERNYNMITIIANVIKPVALGLLYLYGIQGVAESLEKAKEKAYYDFKGFVGMLQGTFRVLEIKCVEAQETEWLREKMYNMDYMTVVRGIPKANKAGEDAGNRGMGGSNINPDSQGTLEEMITGMADYEYVIEVLSTPVYLDTLTGWQRQSQKEMTAWYSQLQGTKSLSMNLSIPMMYMANASQSQGWSKAYTDANSVSYAHGESFSQSEGQSVGESLSRSFGQSIGHSQGQSLTNSVSHGLSTSHGVSFTGLITEISVINNNSIDLNSYKPKCTKDKKLFLKLINGYQEYKEELHLIDFDDMLQKAYEIMVNDKECLDFLRNKYRYIQVDEYQDTNLIQKDIIYLLAGQDGNLAVVGDDDQSIYAFRGAKPEIMLNFQKEYPKSKMVKMSTNYRSGKKIISEADRVIKSNTNRFQKDFIGFKPENGAVEYIVTEEKKDEILKIYSRIKKLLNDGENPADIAVCIRNS